MNKITFGPFFYTASTSAPSGADVVPLGLHMEFASVARLVSIPLFRRPAGPNPNGLRLDHLVFESSGLPIDLECPACQVVETKRETFLPLEALLVALYEGCEVSRSIFQALAELGSHAPFACYARNATPRKGALVSQAEAAGFRLNKVIRDRDQVYADIEWQAAAQSNRFHTRICKFRLDPRGELDEGAWVPAGVIGVASLLARELHHLVPGSPHQIFSPTGLSILQSPIQLLHRS